MPFYEYQCAACGHHHEELQKVTDRPLRKCPACSRTSLKRLVSAPVFRLKGGGWYETDFKSDQEGKRNLAAGEEAESKAEAPKEAAADAKDAGKTAEPKPAADAKADKPEAKRRTAAKPARKPAAKPKARPRAKAPARKK